VNGRRVSATCVRLPARKTVARRIPPSEFITKLNPKRFMEGWVLAPLALGKEKRSRTRYSTRRSAQALATTQISRKARAL
jgi:hypothetical protein